MSAVASIRPHLRFHSTFVNIIPLLFTVFTIHHLNGPSNSSIFKLQDSSANGVSLSSAQCRQTSLLVAQPVYETFAFRQPTQQPVLSNHADMHP
jgi:hypothetical protein